MQEWFFRGLGKRTKHWMLIGVQATHSLCPLCPLWSITLHSVSYLPKISQSFEDAFDLAGALGAFAAELGGEGFGAGGGVGGEKLT